MNYNTVAQEEFQMDFEQLGPNEKEWVKYEFYKLINKK